MRNSLPSRITQTSQNGQEPHVRSEKWNAKNFSIFCPKKTTRSGLVYFPPGSISRVWPSFLLSSRPVFARPLLKVGRRLLSYWRKWRRRRRDSIAILRAAWPLRLDAFFPLQKKVSEERRRFERLQQPFFLSATDGQSLVNECYSEKVVQINGSLR